MPPSVTEALRTVTGLWNGHTTAREMPRVKPVKDLWVKIELPHLSRKVAAMVHSSVALAACPGEVVILRACDIDMTTDVWSYEPREHKGEWRELDRKIPLGPKAQEIIKPFLTLTTDAYLFSPRDAEESRHEQAGVRMKQLENF